MKYPMYSVRDVKAGFMPPTCDQSDQSAIRGFSYSINGNTGLMNFAPKDFDLYKVGEFDTDKGCIIPISPVVLVCSGGSVFGVNDG